MAVVLQGPEVHLSDLLPSLLSGLARTIEVSAFAGALALFVSFVVALLRLSPIVLVRALGRIYVEFFRGTSALVQLFFAYYVLPLWGLSLSPLFAASMALGLNLGAYGSEIVRSAIVGVDRGQVEAAATLNLSPARTMYSIVLPQATRAMLPPFGNLLVELIKVTSLVSLVTVTDLAFAGDSLLGAYGHPQLIYALVLLLYFSVCFPLSQVTKSLERRFQQGAGQRRPFYV